MSYPIVRVNKRTSRKSIAEVCETMPEAVVAVHWWRSNSKFWGSENGYYTGYPQDIDELDAAVNLEFARIQNLPIRRVIVKVRNKTILDVSGQELNLISHYEGIPDHNGDVIVEI